MGKSSTVREALDKTYQREMCTEAKYQLTKTLLWPKIQIDLNKVKKETRNNPQCIDPSYACIFRFSQNTLVN